MDKNSKFTLNLNIVQQILLNLEFRMGILQQISQIYPGEKVPRKHLSRYVLPGTVLSTCLSLKKGKWAF